MKMCLVGIVAWALSGCPSAGATIVGSGTTPNGTTTTGTTGGTTTCGNVTTLAGNGTKGYADATGGPTGTAEFKGTDGVAVDAAGNVFVADLFNNRIRKVDPSGNVTTLVGNGMQGFADGMGGPTGTAEFNGPNGVAVDAAGNVFVGGPRQQPHPQGRPEWERDDAGRQWHWGRCGRDGRPDRHRGVTWRPSSAATPTASTSAGVASSRHVHRTGQTQPRARQRVDRVR